MGIAVDTPKGLLVPVIKNVGRKSLSEISAEISDLSAKARENKISINELTGGTFTISNLGGIGGTGFTPIIYKPQVAILGVSKARMQQKFIENEFRGRMILPLSLSYDHRLIDGADGARFLSWICNAIEKPFAILQ
jgi:pyruvate dehydrogenase E2 component (dihydrolipoamide acetyltransferase)